MITYYTQDHTGKVNHIDSPMIRRVNVRFMRAIVKAALLFILLLWAHVILCITCAILRRYTIWGYMPLTHRLRQLNTATHVLANGSCGRIQKHGSWCCLQSSMHHGACAA